MISAEEITNFDVFMMEEELSKNTRESYILAVKQFFDFTDSLNKQSLIEWKKFLLNKLSPKTVNLRLCGIRKYCEFKKIPFSIKQVKMQKTTSIENILTVEQYNKLLDYLEKCGKIKYKMWFLILAKTGARISEFLQMKKKHLDIGFVELHTKGKIRKILFPKSLLSEIQDFYADYKSDDNLCLNRHGKKNDFKRCIGRNEKNRLTMRYSTRKCSSTCI